MPLTPRFEISQTTTDIVIVIDVPHIRVSANSFEVVIEEDHILHFYAAPYLLKLAFAQGGGGEEMASCLFAVNADEECSTYNPGNGGQDATLTLRLAKATPGVEWPQLDMTARLLQPKSIPTRYDWLKQVVDNEDYTTSGAEDNNANSETEIDTDDSNGLTSEENLLTSQPPEKNIPDDVDGYGFANMFHNIFNDFCRDGLAKEMLQLQHPEETTNDERRQQRMERELEDFDTDRYLGDMNISEEEDYLYPMVMAYQPHWSSHGKTQNQQASSGGDDKLSQQMNQLNLDNSNGDKSDISTGKNHEANATTTTMPSPCDSNSEAKTVYFTPDEQLLLASIPYPLLPDTVLAGCNDSNQNTKSESGLWNGLLDILFAYVYDHLLTQGEATVESAWNISTLSCSLSWLDNSFGADAFTDDNSGNDVVISSLRRMLTYPYLRNLEFGIYVWKQVCEILQSSTMDGDATKCVIRCLLQVRTILEQSELYYLGNKLYIDPYLAWLQRRTASIPSRSLAEHISHKISDQSTSALKEVIGLRLTEYEQLLLQEDEEEGENDDDEGSDSGDSESSSDDDDDDDDDETDSNDETEDASERQTTKDNLKEDDCVGGKLALQEAAPDLPPSIVSTALLDAELETKPSLLEIIPTNGDTAEAYAEEMDGSVRKNNPLIQELE